MMRQQLYMFSIPVLFFYIKRNHEAPAWDTSHKVWKTDKVTANELKKEMRATTVWLDWKSLKTHSQNSAHYFMLPTKKARALTVNTQCYKKNCVINRVNLSIYSLKLGTRKKKEHTHT